MESAFRVAASLPHGTSTRRYTTDEWEQIKPRIQQLYIQEDLTQEQVIHILWKEGFTISYVVPFPILIESVDEAETYLGRSS
jgi:hypothetical protein